MGEKRRKKRRRTSFFFFFKQKTAYEIGTGDWSSDVSSDLVSPRGWTLKIMAPG